MQRVPSRSLTLCLFLALIPMMVMLTGCPSGPGTRDGGRLVPPASAKGTRYTLGPNDTLKSVATKFGVDWRDIIDANPALLKPDNFKAGNIILIPVEGATPRPIPVKPAPVEEVKHNPGHAGPIAAEANFVWPVKGTILCKFARPVPWRKNEANNGIDIRATEKTIVRAAKSGRVNTFDNVPGYGKVVVLEHYDGMVTFYGHLSRILVTHDRWVKQGERIGLAGSSGISSGVELHFRMLRNGKCIDPLPKLP